MAKFKRGDLVKVKKEVRYPKEAGRYSSLLPPHTHCKFELAKVRKIESTLDGKSLYKVTYGDDCEPLLLEEEELVKA